ncbi:hypothetical protein ZIOFF_001498 [Zingiber officinale]|uniref:Uncharacterized protein n=1 Tax=Zingiber officinale TaxID=94328 RepID=A0A8J5HYP9_ZINOF|nr:hypothetical protein ZIOFF_001498 [Zingiber officinale]
MIITVYRVAVYDVTPRDTFTNLSDMGKGNRPLYSTNQDCIKMFVGNKDDKVTSHIFMIKFCTNAKTRVNVEQCFEELVLKILETPSLCAEGSSSVKKTNIFKQKPPQEDASTTSCC